MAREAAASQTSAANARERFSMLSSWYRLPLHQGVDMSEFEPVLEKIGRAGNPTGIDEGYRVLSKIQASPRKHATRTAPAQPIVVEGRVYSGQQGGDKDFYCVDARSGRLIWKKPPGWAWVTAGYRGHKLYAGTVEGDIHCVRTSDGGTLWTHHTNGGVYPVEGQADHSGPFTVSGRVGRADRPVCLEV